MDHIFDSSLALYLPLHELDGASFQSKDAYGHMCTVAGASWRRGGRQFDGIDDYLDIGDVTLFDDASQPITFSLWVKPVDFASPGSQMLLDKFDGGSQCGFTITAYAATGTVLFGIKSGSWMQARSAGSLPDNVFTRIDVTYNGSKSANGVRIHFNAVADTVVPVIDNGPNNDISNNISMQVAARQNTYHFGGTIGELWIFRKVLTQPEISAHYLATKWRYQ